MLKRWLKCLMQEVLEQHDRDRELVVINSNRDPTEFDILEKSGALWMNCNDKRQWVLLRIRAEWEEVR